MELYTKDGKIVDIGITVLDVLEIMSYPEEIIDKMIEEDPIDYKYGLSFNEFLFFCLDIDNPEILNEYTDLFRKFQNKYSSKIEYIEYISILKEKSLRWEFPEFNIHPELLEKLNENINPNYTIEERILYYYFKLCFLLNVDTKYNFACILFDELGAFNFQKSSNRLSTINSDNNEAACFEFAALLDKLMIMHDQVVAGWPFTGDRQHIWSEAVINRTFYKFDALEDPHGRNKSYRDLTNVKLNKGYDGIIVGGEDYMTGVNSHLPYIDRVYNDVQKEFSWFLQQTKFTPEVMSKFFSNLEKINLDEKVKQVIIKYFIKFNRIPLKGVEYYIETLTTYRTMLENETSNFIQLTGVGSTIDGYDFKVVLSTKDKNDDYIYILFGGEYIDILNKNDMIHLLDSNKIIITKSREFIRDENQKLTSFVKYRTIPGIDEEFQKDKNKKAEKTVLWPMLQNVYNESLNTEVTNKVLAKTTTE